MDFITITCCRCNELFGMTRETHAVLKRSSKTFHCPFGHPQHFPLGPTEAEKLQAALDDERRRRERAEQQIARAEQRAATIDRSRNAYKGQVTRLRSRAKAGICPCCNRHFTQLERHMANKHPEFVTEAEEPENENAEG